jgi:FkbM family methyltransferase
LSATIRSAAASVKQSLMDRYNAVRRAPRVRAARRRIFVDCGANTCTVLREFIKRFPDFEFFAFEAQPELAAEGDRVIGELPQTKIQHFSKAVWTRNEELSFYLATRWGSNHRGGSTLVTGHTRNLSAIDYESPVRVEAIDFSSWLAETVDREDYVIVKMDIEGAEYDVLEKVIADGNLPLIDELIIEFHYHMNEAISKARHDALMETLRRTCRVHVWH